MGAKFMDYIIADRFLIPDPATCDEKVVYLPGCFQVNPTWHESDGLAPLSRTELGLPEDAVVFCCFNSSYKIQPALFRVWMELLKSVKQSVLWLAQFNDLAAENLRQEAVKQGIAAYRLLFAPVVPLHEHMRRLPAADLFLDTSPYSAGATASHTLWAGVPLLTLAADSYVSRMAGSLVTAVGCPELIANSLVDYRDRAVQLSSDASLRNALRSRIADNRGNLFNCSRFTTGLERAYQAMWQRFEEKLTPELIDLTP
jgi:predicted O-linked N-acetylglucosamine transferase (SPINDLY family)